MNEQPDTQSSQPPAPLPQVGAPAGQRDMGLVWAGTSGTPAASDVRRLEDLEYALAGISPRRRAFSAGLTNSLRASAEWLEQHWLGVVNGVLGTYVGLAVATPIAFMLGLTGPASAVFRVYRIFCDELPTHSLFIGGYQICLCERCLAIYSTMLAVGIGLAITRRTRVLRAIPWWLWVLAMVPMALDGFTQLFGLRESNLALRLLTGSLFGLATALFTLPQMDAAARPYAHPKSPQREISAAETS